MVKSVVGQLSKDFIMKIRSYRNRICIYCSSEKMVRSDSKSNVCRACSIKNVSNSNIGKFKNIKGIRFGRLVALDLLKVNKEYWWRCICDCGNYNNILGFRLRYGKTRSCGCIVKSRSGLSTSPTYRSWQAMIQRCYDPNVAHYKRYGALGITTCDRWKNSFDSFLADMGERPVGMTLDRIDSNGNYSKENCRWATPSQQSNNRKKNNILTFDGISKSLTLWAKEKNMIPATLRKRIYELKWSTEDSFNIKVRKSKKKRK